MSRYSVNASHKRIGIIAGVSEQVPDVKFNAKAVNNKVHASSLVCSSSVYLNQM